MARNPEKPDESVALSSVGVQNSYQLVRASVDVSQRSVVTRMSGKHRLRTALKPRGDEA